MSAVRAEMRGGMAVRRFVAEYGLLIALIALAHFRFRMNAVR